jgi:hypothetical protein
MSTKTASKLNLLLQNTPSGIVLLSSWLQSQGYSHDLQQRYIKSGWLESIGTGAYKRAGDRITVYGAIYALQQQAMNQIHIGGNSALRLHGISQYIPLGRNVVDLIGRPGTKLPKWFINYQWDIDYTYKTMNMLPHDLGLDFLSLGEFQIKTSYPARAMMECLDSAPNGFDLEEAWLIMEGMGNLHPAQVQSLLENNSSIKTKRLFLFLSEKAEHAWIKQLDLAKINLGSGKRSLVKNGVFVKKYQITVPEIIAR